MAIHLDVFVRMHERQMRRQVKQLANDLNGLGSESGRKFAEKWLNEVEGAGPKVRKAVNEYIKTTQKVDAAGDALSKAWEKRNKALETRAESHAKKMASIEETHAKQMEARAESHAKKLANIDASHARQMEERAKSHAKRMETHAASHAKRMGSYADSMNKREGELLKLIEKSDKAYRDAKKAQEAYTAAVHDANHAIEAYYQTKAALHASEDAYQKSLEKTKEKEQEVNDLRAHRAEIEKEIKSLESARGKDLRERNRKITSAENRLQRLLNKKRIGDEDKHLNEMIEAEAELNRLKSERDEADLAHSTKIEKVRRDLIELDEILAEQQREYTNSLAKTIDLEERSKKTNSDLKKLHKDILDTTKLQNRRRDDLIRANAAAAESQEKVVKKEGELNDLRAKAAEEEAEASKKAQLLRDEYLQENERRIKEHLDARQRLIDEHLQGNERLNADYFKTVERITEEHNQTLQRISNEHDQTIAERTEKYNKLLEDQQGNLREIENLAERNRKLFGGGGGGGLVGGGGGDGIGGGRFMQKDQSLLGRILTDLPFTPSGRAGAFIGGSILMVLASAAEAVVTATQALWTLPAAATAAGAGIGSLAIGLSGFFNALGEMGDLEKFVGALDSLTPSAQQTALEIKYLVDGPIKDLRNVTQESLFAGIPEQIHELANTFLPTIEKLTSGVAKGFNDMFTGIATQLNTPETQSGIGEIVDNTVEAFKKLAPAMGPITDAFVRISEVGSEFLPQFAEGLANAAESFASFIKGAQSRGDIKRWIDEGIEAVKTLWNWLVDLGRRIYETFGGKSPDDFKNTLDQISDLAMAIVEIIRGFASALNSALGIARPLVDAFGGLESVLTKSLAAWAIWKINSISAIKEVSGALTNDLVAAGTSAGSSAGSGFVGAFTKTLRVASWATIGLMIGDGILKGIKDATKDEAGVSLVPDLGDIISFFNPFQPHDGPSRWIEERIDRPIREYYEAKYPIPPGQNRIGLPKATDEPGPRNITDLMTGEGKIIPVPEKKQEELYQSLPPEAISKLPGNKYLDNLLGTMGIDPKNPPPPREGPLPTEGLGDYQGHQIPGVPVDPEEAKREQERANKKAIEDAKASLSIQDFLPPLSVPVMDLGMIPGMPSPYGVPAQPGMYPMAPNPSQTTGYENLKPGAKNLEAALRAAFPQLGRIGGWRPDGQGSSDHPSGSALDIMIPNWDTPAGKQLGDEINRWLHANAGALGIDSTIWQNQMMYTSGKSGGTVPGHMDHIHVRTNESPNALHEPPLMYGTGGQPYTAPHLGYYDVDPKRVMQAQARVNAERFDVAKAALEVEALRRSGVATEEQLLEAEQKLAEERAQFEIAQMELAEAQQGTWKKLTGQTENTHKQLKGIEQQIGAEIDKDFGFSKGISGIFENLFKVIANLAMAPVIGALTGLTSVFGTAGKGSGLLGLLSPRQSMFGTLPNIFGYTGEEPSGYYGSYPSSYTNFATPYGPSATMPQSSSVDFRNFGPPGSKQAIANMIYAMATQRGYSPDEAIAIVAYAIGESGLNPAANGGEQGGSGPEHEVIGLFQQKPGFARAGGIDPSLRADPYYNTLAYLNQLDATRRANPGMPIEQLLPKTSVGGPLSGAGRQAWDPLVNQARAILGFPTSGGTTPHLGPSGVPGPAPSYSQPPSYGSSNIQPRDVGGKGAAPSPAPLSTGGAPSVQSPPGTGPLPVTPPAGMPQVASPGGLPQLFPGAASSPAAAGGPGTGAGFPGMAGPPAMLPGAQPFGAVQGTGTYNTPAMGRAYGEGRPAQEGLGLSGGGLIGLGQSAIQGAMQAGMSAAGVAAPGAGSAAPFIGQAAQIGIDEINRAIEAGAELVGIGVEGLMETFLPVESELADPARSWAGRILGSIAGVSATVPNLAGNLTEQMQGDKPLTPEQVAAQKERDAMMQSQGQGGEPQVNVQINNSKVPDIRSDAEVHQIHANMAPGGRT